MSLKKGEVVKEVIIGDVTGVGGCGLDPPLKGDDVVLVGAKTPLVGE